MLAVGICAVVLYAWYTPSLYLCVCGWAKAGQKTHWNKRSWPWSLVSGPVQRFRTESEENNRPQWLTAVAWPVEVFVGQEHGTMTTDWYWHYTPQTVAYICFSPRLFFYASFILFNWITVLQSIHFIYVQNIHITGFTATVTVHCGEDAEMSRWLLVVQFLAICWFV